MTDLFAAGKVKSTLIKPNSPRSLKNLRRKLLSVAVELVKTARDIVETSFQRTNAKTDSFVCDDPSKLKVLKFFLARLG